ncbi:50S ribosomal protein L33 [Candidatus Curtissbacteria bacterium RIFCSPHIGHO2_01_FULL_41_11]|uniref:Large ribosomal subunit protein bL33 n=1 Tax=Candidatus Curtissbacteria bacterium RIFCSPHIGHO2_01_FULL_41_11 TaxID=1797711 RepID=A0A1F5G5B7_9BACT|nr:MAG: 50S ribosomal protein L33 [Candidatus Curtissbacteria bacterium RIFCSPHIGHO2_01_FULL_41_11]
MAKSKRVLFQLECTVCRARNYTTQRNPDNTKDKLTLKKYCKHDRKITEHREVKIS